MRPERLDIRGFRQGCYMVRESVLLEELPERLSEFRCIETIEFKLYASFGDDREEILRRDCEARRAVANVLIHAGQRIANNYLAVEGDWYVSRLVLQQSKEALEILAAHPGP